MGKIGKSIICIFLFVNACRPVIKNIDSQGKSIICLGDSITYGVGATHSKGYPSVLEKLLGVNVINAGVGGDTTEDALVRLESDVLKRDPRLVVVELGGNDFLKKVAMRHTLRNLEEIIMRIQEQGAMVVLCDTSSLFAMRAYRREFEKLARETGSLFVPKLLEGILENPNLKSDYIHPNNAGYEIVAQRIYQAIKPYVK